MKQARRYERPEDAIARVELEERIHYTRGAPRLRWAIGRLLCLFGAHDLFAWCNGRETTGPEPGHPSHPQTGDSMSQVRLRFAAWTKLRCRRCGWTSEGA